MGRTDRPADGGGDVGRARRSGRLRVTRTLCAGARGRRGADPAWRDDGGGVLALATAQPAGDAGCGVERGGGRDGLFADPPERMEPAVLQRPDHQGSSRVFHAAEGLCRSGQPAVDAERGADMAEPDLETRAAHGLGRGPFCRLARAAAGVPADILAHDGREPGPALAGGCPASCRSDHGSVDRAVAIDAAAGLVYRGAVGVVRRYVHHTGGRAVCAARLHGVVRAVLRRHGLVPKLACRAPPDPAGRGPLRARGGPALWSGIGEREHRKHHAIWRRSERDGAASCSVRRRSGNLSPHHRGGDPADVDHGGLWVVYHCRAYRGRRTRIFRRQDDVWRVDDGSRRLQSGATIAALVCRQFPLDCGLAGDIAARCGLPPRRADHGYPGPERAAHRAGCKRRRGDCAGGVAGGGPFGLHPVER
ncbi:hypothetical protein GALL_462280 [mine drainage metagenome]|uniref:Uncharacterized protein n=1 Tax=mine drainage metagenome TaxID=410659 RepID=A0A1J5Q879_9ZZZZ